MAVSASTRGFVETYLQPLRTYWMLWVIPTIALTVLAVAYSFLAPKNWLASQQVVVRNESLGSTMQLGRFDSYDSMKTVEETIHAVAKSANVIESVLAEVGPPEGKPKENWPSRRDVDSFMANVSVTAPNGAIFGQTEIIYVNVKASSQERAIEITSKLCDEMERRLNALRAERSAGIEQELQQAVDVSEQNLETASASLAAIEHEIGVDLGELRNLDQQLSGGTGMLQQELGDARENVRLARRELAQIELRRQHLESVNNNVDQIVSVPSTILVSHPALGRLKDGWVDADLRMAQVLSQYDETHPRSLRVATEVAEVEQRLRRELRTAIAEAEFDRVAAQERLNMLSDTEQTLIARVARLSELRVEYNTTVASVEQRKNDFGLAQSQLAEVQGLRRAANSSSIISRVEEPVVSADPIGPGKKLIAAGGLVCGLAIGIGLVFLVAPPTVEPTNLSEVSNAEASNTEGFDGEPATINQGLAAPVAPESMPTQHPPTDQPVAAADVSDLPVVPANSMLEELHERVKPKRAITSLEQALESHSETIDDVELPTMREPRASHRPRRREADSTDAGYDEIPIETMRRGVGEIGAPSSGTSAGSFAPEKMSEKTSENMPTSLHHSSEQTKHSPPVESRSTSHVVEVAERLNPLDPASNLEHSFEAPIPSSSLTAMQEFGVSESNSNDAVDDSNVQTDITHSSIAKPETAQPEIAQTDLANKLDPIQIEMPNESIRPGSPTSPEVRRSAKPGRESTEAEALGETVDLVRDLKELRSEMLKSKPRPESAKPQAETEPKTEP